jgi:hypothetical protein
VDLGAGVWIGAEFNEAGCGSASALGFDEVAGTPASGFDELAPAASMVDSTASLIFVV